MARICRRCAHLRWSAIPTFVSAVALVSVGRDAAFHDLLAEGAFLVSALRRKGRTRFLRIRSLAGEPCRLKTDLTNPMLLTPTGRTPLTPGPDGVITLNINKGAEAVLVAADYDGPLTIEPVPLPPGDCNYYGLKAGPWSPAGPERSEQS